MRQVCCVARSRRYTPEIGYDTRSQRWFGRWLNPCRRCGLRYVTTTDASRLTDLSTEKLREWTRRRALIPADVPPKQQGSPAKFSWQTVLVLRVAVLLRKRFKLELKAHQASFAQLREIFREQSFTALRGQRLVLEPGSWSVIDRRDPLPVTDFLVVWLDPHLEVLDKGFGPPEEGGAGVQLELWPLDDVREMRKAEVPGEPAPPSHRGPT